MELIFATHNQHKVDELKHALPARFNVLTLAAAGIDKDIPEPHDSLEANAAEKARTIHRLTGKNCFSEDTGLEVKALDGAPGVRSARYAGEARSAEANMTLLLRRLDGQTDRSARFRTVICLILEKEEYYFEGICTGRIALEPEGVQGFGYDPLFIPDGADRSFAQMNTEEKNRYSHRRKAAEMLVTFLNQWDK